MDIQLLAICWLAFEYIINRELWIFYSLFKRQLRNDLQINLTLFQERKGMTNSDRDRAVSEEKLNQFVMKVANDFGAAWITVLVNIGDKLGLYKEMVNSGPITSEELAKRTGTA
jgi:hypothetical protein